MFTWICPQCGREVPPSAAECPNCVEMRAKAAQAAAQPPAAPPAPPQPPYAPQQFQAPPQQYPPQPQYQQPQYQPPQYPQYQPPLQQQPQPAYVIAEPKKGMPSWLVAILVTAVIGGGLFGVYKLMGTGTSADKKAEGPVLEKAGPAATGSGGIYGKFLEVTAFRLVEDSAKKPRVRFTVVNHSTAPMSGLELQLSLGRVGEEGQPPFAVVDAKVGQIEPNGTKEVDLPIQTSLRIYELPDWQFIKGSFVVTAPK